MSFQKMIFMKILVYLIKYERSNKILKQRKRDFEQGKD